VTTSDPIPFLSPKLSANTPRLVQSLGLFSSTALVVGSMIGSGITCRRGHCTRHQLSGAFSGRVGGDGDSDHDAAAQLRRAGGRLMPKAGGQYVYLRESLGPLWGFLYAGRFSWSFQTGTIAAVAVPSASFLGVFFPAVSSGQLALAHRHVPALRWDDGAGQHGDRRQHGESDRALLW